MVNRVFHGTCSKCGKFVHSCPKIMYPNREDKDYCPKCGEEITEWVHIKQMPCLYCRKQ